MLIGNSTNVGNGRILIEYIYVCSDHCYSCNADQTCDNCTDNYNLWENKCYTKCPNGTTKTTSQNKCVRCNSICKTCSSSTTHCDSCNSGRYLYMNSCYTDCSQFNDKSKNIYYGKDLVNYECKKCAIKNCISCSSNYLNCLQCAENYHFDAKLNQCIINPTETFSESNAFTKSNTFSESNVFTKSSKFTKSSYFTRSSKFTDSLCFTKSSELTKSSIFSESLDFSGSSYFTKSLSFSLSMLFSMSSLFSQSISFSASKYFSESSIFSFSSLFTNSISFTSSDSFSKSSIFSQSMIFSKSSGFSKSFYFSNSDTFSQSDRFSLTYVFTISFQFSCSSYFSKSSPFTESSQFSKSSFFRNPNDETPYKIIKSMTLSVSFIQKKSVSFSISMLKSYSNYMSYDHNLNTYLILSTENEYYIYVPYIIQYLTRTYIQEELLIEIRKPKGITSQQLIGIVSGTSAIFFLILYIIIIMYRKTHYNNEFNESLSYLENSSETGTETKSEQNENNINTNPTSRTGNEHNTTDNDLDFWL